jgi:hypothetical protein
MNKALTITLILASVIACSKHEVPTPVIHEFSANPTTFPRRDTITFTINAEGDFITFFDGKALIDLSGKPMPYSHRVGRIRFNVSPPADTVWAKLAVTNVYDTDNIKSVSDSIELILLSQ